MRIEPAKKKVSELFPIQGGHPIRHPLFSEAVFMERGADLPAA